MRKSNKRKKERHAAGQGELFATGTHVPSRKDGGGTFKERTGLAELLSRLTSQLASTEQPEILTETAVVRRVCPVVWGDGGESRLLPD